MARLSRPQSCSRLAARGWRLPATSHREWVQLPSERHHADRHPRAARRPGEADCAAAVDRELNPRARGVGEQLGLRGQPPPRTADGPAGNVLAEAPVSEARHRKEQDLQVVQRTAHHEQYCDWQMQHLEHMVAAPPDCGQRGHEQCWRDEEG
eukprot:6729943-Prymnesium_polylepis.2